MALNDLTIKNLKPKSKTYRIADSEGLTIEISPTGSKLWRYRYRYQDKGQMISLGKYPAISLADARRKRDAARALLDEGKNPAREKQAAKLRRAQECENTFESAARHCLSIMQQGLNEKYARQNINRLEQHVFPMIGALPITEITIPDVARVVETISKRGTHEIAKRMKQVMAQVFRFASQRGLCMHNPAADLRDILPTRSKKHFACIHPSELPDLLRAMNSRERDLGNHAMQLLALTFVRTGELIGARWAEIDWAKEEWHIPAERMKMKRPHVVPLSKQTLAILREVEKSTGNREFVFFSAASASKHISNGIILMALRRMGYQGRMTGHGFRSLASTILNEKGYAPDVIERQLAHEDEDQVRSAYNRAEYLLERKKMMQDYANFLDKAAKVTPNKVISMGRNKMLTTI